MLLDVHVLARGERSRTKRLRDAFLAAFSEAHPTEAVQSVDLCATASHLPELDAWDLSAKYALMDGDVPLDGQEAAHWARVRAVVEPLHQATYVLLSAPMWNLSVPWQLKRWLDVVVQPGLTFERLSTGFRGLLGGRTAIVLTSRDGAFLPGQRYAAMDHQLPLLADLLQVMGFSPIHQVVAEPLGHGSAEAQAAALADAVIAAQQLGRSLR